MGLFQLINTRWSHSRKNWMGEFNFSQCYLGPLFSFCSFFTKWCCSLVFGCYLLSDFHRQAFMQSFLHKCRFVCGQEHALKPSKHSSPMRSSLCLQSCGCNYRIETSAFKMLWNPADKVHVGSTCETEGWEEIEVNTQIAFLLPTNLTQHLVKKQNR